MGMEVSIQREFEWDDVRIYIRIKSSSQYNAECSYARVIVDDSGVMDFEFAPVVEGAIIPPTLRLPVDIAEVLIRAIVDFAEKEGVKPARQETLQGVLDTQTKHLHDMRKLLGSLADIDLGD